MSDNFCFLYWQLKKKHVATVARLEKLLKDLPAIMTNFDPDCDDDQHYLDKMIDRHRDKNTEDLIFDQKELDFSDVNGGIYDRNSPGYREGGVFD